MNLDTNKNNVAMGTNANGKNTDQVIMPPITSEEHEQDKKSLPRADFLEQLILSGVPQEEAEGLASEIYGEA